jgi:muconate cycloisomerase
LEAILIGRSPRELTALQMVLGQETWKHQVLCGVDIALHDALARVLDVPLYQLFGGKVRQRIPFAYPLAPCRDAADLEANLGRIERLQAQGHRAVRYYFGQVLAEDERFLREMRRRWGDAVELVALDASGRFTVPEAIEAVQRFAEFAPGLFESPVKGRHDAPVEDFLAVKAQTPVPISEHVADFAVAARLAQHGAIDIFNTGLGYAGIAACRKVFAVAEVFGISALMGSTVEMSIGTAARAQLAAAVPELAFPCYMAGPLVYAEDVVVEPIAYEVGHIIIPEGPGLGIELDRDRMEKLRLS